jgi:hypothetical protein
MVYLKYHFFMMRVGCIVFCLFFCFQLAAQQRAGEGDAITWTYTYLKAKAGQRASLKNYLEKNWFAMDSVAVKNHLIKSYELIQNLSEESDASWDYIVAVEYFTRDTYDAIAQPFEEIRKKHTTVLVNGLSFKDLGTIVRSEKVTRQTYSPR